MKGLKGVQEPLIELKRLEDDGDRVVHDAIAALFRDDRIDPLIVIRWKDVYEGLERAIDSCETVANVVANIAVKNASPPTAGRISRSSRSSSSPSSSTSLTASTTRRNAIATSVSTRALPPRAAVLSAAVLNVLGAFVSLAVAATIASGIVDAEAITLNVVLAGLVGAITWNLVTWYLGLPSSSSHALIGGVLGSSVAAAGWGVVKWDGLKDKVLIPSLIAPFAGLAIAAALMIAITWVIPAAVAGVGQPRLSPAPARLRRLRRLHPRHKRRSEDDGDHRACIDHQRPSRAGLRPRRPG